MSSTPRGLRFFARDDDLGYLSGAAQSEEPFHAHTPSMHDSRPPSSALPFLPADLEEQLCCTASIYRYRSSH
jgi:hypothetical protein